MSHTVQFENAGEIDPRSVYAFGVSVKEGESPIGFFGTGLKYAIAVLLRTGHEVAIFSGATRMSFSTTQQQVRGKNFDFVQMEIDGQTPRELGFTTELGKQWEVWMAYREIACNCKDEGGETRYLDDGAPAGASGVTRIVVTGAAFAEAYENRHAYILDDLPKFVVGQTEVRDRTGQGFYYRGVRVHNFGAPAIYTYNSTGHMALTEDRTLKHQHEADSCVRRTIMRSDDAKFIEACITADERTVEGSMDYHGWSITPSETFLRVVGECMSDRMLKVNPTATKVWRECTKQPFAPAEVYLTKVQLMSLEKALDFCAGIGFPIRGAYPIKVVETLGDGGLGLAHEGTIYVAERVFHLGGTKQLASTLIEEYLHLRHGWADMTRELQSFLFDKMVSLGEELAGEPL